MKKLTFLILVMFTGNATYAQGTSDNKAGLITLTKPESEIAHPSKAETQVEVATKFAHTASVPESDVMVDDSKGMLAQGQDKGKPSKKDDKKETSSDKAKKEDVKEVASAKRQQKPEKVDANAEVQIEAKAPKSAARPGRGAARVVQGTATTATKVVGNAGKAVKPVKVGGKVGAGAVIKVGKN